MSEARLFHPHPRYRILLLAWLALFVFFGWSLWQRTTVDVALFMAISLGLALFHGHRLVSRVELGPDGLTLAAPLRAPTHIAFRQLVSASAEGRLNQAIHLVYYPIRADGLLELSQPTSLTLPTLVDQADLLDILQQEMPR